MARIKITGTTIEAKLTKWFLGQERTDELIFYQNEINADEWKQKAWDLGMMIIDIVPDSVTGFFKIVFVEKL